MKKIETPTNCPSCDSKLIWRSQLLYCINDLCGEQGYKKVEHFVKTLRIKGLGPKTIEKLDISDSADLYLLTEKYLIEVLGSEKVAKKIIEEIDKSVNIDLESLLPAFAIPLMGRSASEKLCRTISNIDEISIQSCQEAGLGPKVTDNLLTWLEGFDFTSYPFTYEVSKQLEVNTANKGTVCITGKLTSFKNKSEAKKALIAAGYAVKDGVTKEVTILVNESGVESTKIKKAREKNILIISNLKELFGE